MQDQVQLPALSSATLASPDASAKAFAAVRAPVRLTTRRRRFPRETALSPANGVVGVIHAAALAVHFIGEGLPLAEGLGPKHAMKQVDRLLSNPAMSVETFFARWVPFVVAERKTLRFALDWAEFDRDGQTTIALYLLTRHGPGNTDAVENGQKERP